ncbi:MAG TPA: hypothetical protein VMB51_05355 [Solirubrobacteraceae bacterium]|nr:hypothetical protein [Solirubrobacteraceae bacterium]
MAAAAKAARHGKPTCGDFGGISKQTGKPCGRPAGWGTEHAGKGRRPGTGKCRFHFGTTEVENEKAREARALEACETLGIPHDGITPEQALLAELWECLGNIDFYRRQVQRLPPAPEPDTFTPGNDGEKGTWERGATGIYGRTYHQSGIPTGEAKPHVLVVLYERERDRLRAIAESMLRAGVEERRVQLAEADAAMVFTGITAALTAMGLEERLEEFRGHFADALSHGHRALPRRASRSG